MSEQPREGTRVDALAEALFRAQNSESEWPPMRWSNVGNEYLADAWREKARNLLRRLELLPSEPAQSQPREGSYNQYLPGDLADRENIGNPEVLCGPACCEPAQPQPRGEGDDLAARTVQIIRNRAKIAREQGTTEAQIIRARALDEAANEFADILPALRASTHPEQWARVDPDDLEVLREVTQASWSSKVYAPLKRILAALEPASPTPAR